MRTDYVIVGASSAGCALAERLTEDPSVRVLLIDAGGRDHNPWIHIPLGYARTYRDFRANWMFDSGLGGNFGERTPYRPWTRARARRSRIDGLIFVSGERDNFNGWARLGCRGWGWDDVLPYFHKAEYWGRDEPFGGEGARLLAGRVDNTLPLYRAIAETQERIGFNYREVIDSWSDAGVIRCNDVQVGRQPLSSGRRDARLPRLRSNLAIVDNALVKRVLFDGRRAVGIEYLRGDALHRIETEREVILSAGAIGSPTLLQLSGVGPPDYLNRLGIPVHHALDGVGRNLQDPYMVRIERPMLPNMSQYLFARTGDLSPVSLVAAPVKVMEESEAPEIDCIFVTKPEAVFHSLGAGISQIRPVSRGYVRITSADHHQSPEVNSQFLSEETDQRTIVAGLRFINQVFDTPTFAQYSAGGLYPSFDAKADDELLDYARRYASAVYQASGTCKMGTDEMAVVDNQLRVRGLGGLRIIDASVMPTANLPSTERSSITIGEKGADMIRVAARSTARAGQPSPLTAEPETASTAEPRAVNVWVSEHTLEVDEPFTVSMNIGASQGKGVSHPFTEPPRDPELDDAEPIDLVVSLYSLNCAVAPSWQELKLPRQGDTDVIRFTVVALSDGVCELSIRVYLSKRLILLQSVSFTVTVSPARVEAST
jgi:choline dehydrogenase